jgi:hypothetical protein
MKRLTLALMVVVLLVAGILPSAAQPDTPETVSGAALVPPDFELYVWIDITNLETLDRVGRAFDQAFSFFDIYDIANPVWAVDSILNEPVWQLGLDYDSDVASWLGETALIAFSDIPNLSYSSSERMPDHVTIVEVDDRNMALWTMQRALITAKQQGWPFEELYYRGAPLFYSAWLSFALLDDYLVFGSLDRVRDVIDVYAGETPSLAGDDNFARVVADAPAPATVGVYLGASGVGTMLADVAGASNDLAALAVQAANPVDGAALTLRMLPDAVMLDLTFAIDSDAAEMLLGEGMGEFAAGTASGRVFQALPVDTPVALVGRDLPAWYHTLRAWAPLLEPLAARLNHELAVQYNYQGPALTGLLRAGSQAGPLWFERLTGLNLEDDVLGWMEAEFAVALVPMSPYLLEGWRTSRFPYDVIAVAEVSDPDLAAGTLDQFTQSVQELGFPLLTQQIGGMEMYTMRLAQHQRLLASWALADAFGAMATGVYSIDRFLSLAQFGGPSMLDNPTLQEALEYLGGPGHTMLFVNVEQAAPYLLSTLPQDSSLRGRWLPTLQTFDSLALSARAADNDVYAVTLLGVLSRDQ